MNIYSKDLHFDHCLTYNKTLSQSYYVYSARNSVISTPQKRRVLYTTLCSAAGQNDDRHNTRGRDWHMYSGLSNTLSHSDPSCKGISKVSWCDLDGHKHYYCSTHYYRANAGRERTVRTSTNKRRRPRRSPQGQPTVNGKPVAGLRKCNVNGHNGAVYCDAHCLEQPGGALSVVFDTRCLPMNT
jgi:hypothetical protein